MPPSQLELADVAGDWQNVVTIEEITYHYLSEPVKILSASELQLLKPVWGAFVLGPCVIIPIIDHPHPTDDLLQGVLSDWLDRDDVLSVGFIKEVIIWTFRVAQPNETEENTESADLRVTAASVDEFPYLKELGTRQITIFNSQSQASSSNIARGPHFWKWGGFHSVYRLYEDSQDAFFSAIVQHGQGDSFSEMRPASYIPVPSRLYFAEPTEERPLSGLRFGVKDVIDISGLKTSAGSRSYYATYPPRGKTASAIEKLLSLGAVLVGKTKNTQFANGEDPQEWIDYSCPWNPRGDGYQNPDTSSSGSACAVASYDWLDFAVGSDTCGSIACPASVQGLFALRFSTGKLPHDGIFTISKHLDSIGFFCRSIDLLSNIAAAWMDLPGSKSLSQKDIVIPDAILYPWPSFPHINPEVTEVVDEFLKSMEAFAKRSRREIDFSEEWEKSGYKGSDAPLIKLFQNTTAHLHLAGFHDNIQDFRHDYRTKHKREPYLDRVNSEKLKLARDLHHEDRLRMVSHQKLFADFVASRILQSTSRQETLDSIMIWPFSPQEPQYRDNYPSLTPHVKWRWDIDYTAPLAGLPQVILPIGQYRYHSRITGEIEYLPICVSVVAPQGSDHVLLNFLKAFLYSSNLPTKVQTGRLAFE